MRVANHTKDTLDLGIGISLGAEPHATITLKSGEGTDISTDDFNVICIFDKK